MHVWLFPELEFLPGAARLLAIWRWAVEHCAYARPDRNANLKRLIAGPGCEPDDSTAWRWETNCATSTLGVLRHALGSRDACHAVPCIGRTLADPLRIGLAFSDMMVAGQDMGALAKWAGDRSQFTPGRAVRRYSGNNNDHVESIRGVLDASGQMRVETVGGGRANLGITAGVDADFLGGRPVTHVWDWPALVDRLSPARPVMSDDERRIADEWRAETDRINGVVLRMPRNPLEDRETLPEPE
jgi:hypothetical protein